MGDRITYIGLDVRKDGIVVAVAEGGLNRPVPIGWLRIEACFDRLVGAAALCRSYRSWRMHIGTSIS
jgi:hypothetical protein